MNITAPPEYAHIRVPPHEAQLDPRSGLEAWSSSRWTGFSRLDVFAF